MVANEVVSQNELVLSCALFTFAFLTEMTKSVSYSRKVESVLFWNQVFLIYKIPEVLPIDWVKVVTCMTHPLDDKK